MLPLSGTIWLQRNSQTRSKPFRRAKRAIRIIYPCTLDMPYTSAIFLADLPTMSDRRDQLARKLFKSTIQPTSSLHNLLSLFGNIHLSLDYESPQNFLASPPEPINTNHSSHMLSPTITLHNCVFPQYLLFLCFLSTIIVQPLAITFNKRYDIALHASAIIKRLFSITFFRHNVILWLFFIHKLSIVIEL